MKKSFLLARVSSAVMTAVMATAAVYAIGAIVAIGASEAQAAEFKVVASADFPASDLSANDLRDLYLGSTKRMENGKPVQPSHGPVSASYMEEFLGTIVQYNVRDFLTYWRIKVFSSRGLPPRSFASDDQVIFFLHNNSEAIGIVSSKTDIGQLKVINLQN